MLKRKIEKTLESWKKRDGHKPLVVKGCRQCGKTYSVLHFARCNYENVVYLNFVEQPELAQAFSGSLTVDNIVLNLSPLLPGSSFTAGKTCIIFDEVQECPAARSSFKFFHLDGRFDVIATGSLLGVKGYGLSDTSRQSIPVGYETIVEMYSLDFEEFLWAMGIGENVIEKVGECLKELTPVPEAIHNRFRDLLRQYTIVGGMPAVVEQFVNDKNLNDVLAMQRDIVDEYKDDIIKYAPVTMRSKIRQCFESIPRQLSKENKKFQYSLLSAGAKSSQYADCLQWIEDAGIIIRCYNMNIPQLPLDGNAIDSVFKVYMADSGLFVSMLGDGTQADILAGKLLTYKGAIVENLVAEIFHKMSRKLYYYRKDSGLEVDFVIRYKSHATLVEVKSGSGNTKSTRTILNHPEKYGVMKAIKLGDYNIGNTNGMVTLPSYLAFMLREM